MTRTLLKMDSIIGTRGRASGNKKKRLWSPSFAGYHAKLDSSNNLTISSKLFNKGGCNGIPYNWVYKCKDCGSKKYRQSTCTKGKKKN